LSPEDGKYIFLRNIGIYRRAFFTAPKPRLCEILGSHGGEYDYVVLGFDAMPIKERKKR
jgi:hypothetical protein